jgi:DNA-binding transcriptional MocR family regulator
MTYPAHSWHAVGSSLPESLAWEMREQIVRGSISPGQALPSERTLAAAAGVSRTTVTAALDLLEAAGWCERRVRARAIVRLPHLENQTTAPTTGDEGMIDLVAARVAAPAELLERAVERASRQLRRYLLTDGRRPAGLDDLRAGIAERLTRDGLPTTPEQMLITNGAMGALDAVLQCTRGVIVAEDPTYHVALELMSGRRRRVVGWTRGRRWEPDALFDIVRRNKPDVAYLVPDFHNPTGALASNAEREGIASLEGSVPFVVVDETLRDLDLSPEEDKLPTPGHLATVIPTAITIGGLSKNVWSGLRVGWMRVPVRQQLELLSRYTDIQPCPLLEQLIATEVLADLDHIVQARNRRLRIQRDALIGALRSSGVDVAEPAGGLVLWLDLEAPIADAVAQRLSDDCRIAVAPGRRFGIAARHLDHLRIPFTHDQTTLLATGQQIADTVHDLRPKRYGHVPAE